MKLDISPDIIARIKAHAISQYPHECCGAITTDGYLPMVNLHPEPNGYFDCADQAAPLQRDGRLLALVHSHTNGLDGPSASDVDQQIAMNVPWGLLTTNGETASEPWFWGDMLDPPELLGRKWRHGPSGTDGNGDCFALVRDWYRLNWGLHIIDGGRDHEWWESGAESLYLDNFERAGFVVSPDGDRAPRVGDAMLFQFAGPVPSHAGIYVGGGLFMHHYHNRLSRHDPVGPYSKFVVRWLRHVDAAR